MRQVVRYVCSECNREHQTPEMAIQCELSDRKFRNQREVALAKEIEWQLAGHDVWHEQGGMKHAPVVDKKKFGPHNYEGYGTSDCEYKCGCWMGPAASGGSVNPFGACPNNPLL